MSADITALLSAAAKGDGVAAARILPAVYKELRSLAAARMKRTPPGQTLQPTALVHEAYLRLVGSGSPDWESRAHFFFAAARAMRDILVEQARRRASLKRGGDRQRVKLGDEFWGLESPVEDVLALHEALGRLEAESPEAAQITLLRYFSGLTTPEAAELMGISVATAERRWRLALAFLRSDMEGTSAREDV
ncbi:MAG: RNA polymerase subunit sigma [Phycisphaerae bacterium]|nr:MAG: RNA polymerase subunit sigma [Planctomycetota bacterium]KAB2949224.1 MAG: RNA polymerase subunit sigma [Phycisphaerae bacterium]MBE7455711.1 RNA polymerase subunit sigma [Planctomycetia bacterium]MCK6463347.1 ECF-type sigma factor [Phycisphaerae bacterium]MCL4716969.1 RNA polymerase subunit sigma [Phycisphaerae bacterium]